MSYSDSTYSLNFLPVDSVERQDAEETRHGLDQFSQSLLLHILIVLVAVVVVILKRELLKQSPGLVVRAVNSQTLELQSVLQRGQCLEVGQAAEFFEHGHDAAAVVGERGGRRRRGVAGFVGLARLLEEVRERGLSAVEQLALSAEARVVFLEDFHRFLADVLERF